MTLKTYLIIATVLVVTAISSLGLYHKINTLSTQRDRAVAAYNISKDSISYYKNKDSITVGQVKTTVVDKDLLKAMFPSITEDFVKQTNRNIKNLESVLKTQVNSKEIFYINNIDSNKCDSLNITAGDNYTKINVKVLHGESIVDYSHILKLTKYTYSKRKGEPWYKPWKWGSRLVTDIKSENPKDSLSAIQEIIIKK